MPLKDLAAQVLKKYWEGNLPVDPSAIAKAMGARVQPDHVCSSLSGSFTLTDKGPLILFNPTENEMRQRFTIAHELGHYVLGHGNEFRDSARSFNANGYDPKETAANQFAASLLMPASAITHFVRDKGMSDIQLLAAKFFVSEVAMKYRLKNLGYVS
jgi:Zn-dependent peptidase ImmA (M78 family)